MGPEIISQVIVTVAIIAYVASTIFNYKFFKEKFKDERYAYLGYNMFNASPYIFMPFVNWVATIQILKILKEEQEDK